MPLPVLHRRLHLDQGLFIGSSALHLTLRRTGERGAPPGIPGPGDG
ncbi:hypothetical protein [Streptomyces sp. DSS69]|nr:hypothetical protein [Streptomyces sp. SJ1-7]